MTRVMVGRIPLLLCAALLALGGCRDAKDTDDNAPAAPNAATPASDPNRVILTVEAVRQAGIATEVIHPGPFSVTLTLSARLSPIPETSEEVEARLRYQSADHRLHQASVQVERLRKLSAENVVAAKSVTEAETELAQAQVEWKRAETEARNLGIDPARKAAFPAADIWALADLYDPQVSQVKEGARAWVRVESFSSETFPSRVVALSHSLKLQTRTLTARIAVEDPRHRLRAQEPASVEVEVAQSISLSVPSESLLFEGTGRIVFVKRSDGFEKTRVRVGSERGGRTEILDGLADGDAVVTTGAQVLLGELSKIQLPGEED